MMELRSLCFHNKDFNDFIQWLHFTTHFSTTNKSGKNLQCWRCTRRTVLRNRPERPTYLMKQVKHSNWKAKGTWLSSLSASSNSYWDTSITKTLETTNKWEEELINTTGEFRKTYWRSDFTLKVSVLEKCQEGLFPTKCCSLGLPCPCRQGFQKEPSELGHWGGFWHQGNGTRRRGWNWTLPTWDVVHAAWHRCFRHLLPTPK